MSRCFLSSFNPRLVHPNHIPFIHSDRLLIKLANLFYINLNLVISGLSFPCNLLLLFRPATPPPPCRPIHVTHHAERSVWSWILFLSLLLLIWLRSRTAAAEEGKNRGQVSFCLGESLALKSQSFSGCCYSAESPCVVVVVQPSPVQFSPPRIFAIRGSLPFSLFSATAGCAQTTRTLGQLPLWFRKRTDCRSRVDDDDDDGEEVVDREEERYYYIRPEAVAATVAASTAWVLLLSADRELTNDPEL